MANPTTNYGWPMPTATDLVTDLPADFAAFGQPVDTSLKALNPETTLGDISYRSATANTNTRLAIGSTGNVLTVAGGVPTWAAPAGGGKLLQVVSATYSTPTTVATTTYTDTGLSLSITPTLSTSKILVLVVQHYQYSRSGYDQGNAIRLLRGATTVYEPAGTSLTDYHNSTGATVVAATRLAPMTYLDSPATTSATTYKVQGKLDSTSSSGTQQFQSANGISTITLMEIGA